MCIPLLVSRVNGHTKVDRGARDSAMGFDSASMMSSELESSSFVDSEEDEDTSRLVPLLLFNSPYTRGSPGVYRFLHIWVTHIALQTKPRDKASEIEHTQANIKLQKNSAVNVNTLTYVIIVNI